MATNPANIRKYINVDKSEIPMSYSWMFQLFPKDKKMPDFLFMLIRLVFLQTECVACDPLLFQFLCLSTITKVDC